MANTQRQPTGLEDLPLEILYEVSSYLEQHDVASLRLVSRAPSRINISYLLHTFPFHLSFNSFARAIALTENPNLSSFVHELAFGIRKEDFAQEAPSDVIQGIDVYHETIVKDLGSRYILNASHAQDRITLWDLTCVPPEGKFMKLYYRAEYSYGFMRTFLVTEALNILIGQFPKLGRIRMTVANYHFDLRFRQKLIIRESTSPFETDDQQCLSHGLMAWILRNAPTMEPSRIVNLEIHLPSFRVRNRRRLVDLEAIRPELKRLSLSFADVHPMHVPKGRTGFEHDVVSNQLRMLFRFIHSGQMADLEDVELKLPPGGYFTEDGVTPRRPNVCLVELIPMFLFCRIRKFDVGFFSVCDDDLLEILGDHRSTLRELKLTRVDLNSGSWVGLFRDLRTMLGRLETAEFCGEFGEAESACSVLMETVVAEEVLGVDEGTPRTIGSWLGEICLSQTAPDDPLRDAVLSILEKSVRKDEV